MRRTSLVVRLPWFAALLVGCGDDGSAGPDEGASSSGTDSEASASTPSTDSLTSADTSGMTMVSASNSADETSMGSVDATDTDADSDGTADASADASTGPGNAVPVTADDVFYTVQDEAIDVDAAMGVLANDVDADGEALTVSDADTESQYGGTVVVDADGAVAYTPAAGFWGPDTFSYTVTDGIDEATGTVTINVAPRLVPLGDITMGISGFILNGEVIGDRAGHSIAQLGDVDGDGRDDVIIGASRVDVDDVGRAYVVFGKADTEATQLSEIVAGNGGFALLGEGAGDNAGNSVARAGDVDGDGLDDVIIGAQYADGNGGDSGRAYVVFGKAETDTVDLADVVDGDGGFAIDGEGPGDRAGYSVAGIGDVDGDGLDDLLVGAFFAEAGGPASGRSYVVFGKADGDTIDLGAVAAGDGGFAIDGEAGYDNSGISVSGAGDIDGDGIDDLVIGAPYVDAAGGDAGRAYVVFGTDDAGPIDLAAIAAGNGGFAIDGDPGMAAAYPVAGAGDVDGDGLADVIVGAFQSSGVGEGSGRAFVVFGKADGDLVSLTSVLGGAGGFAIEGAAAGDEAGRSIAGVGDLDGDGLGDVLVGAPGSDDGGAGQDAGRVYVVYGKATGEVVLLSEIATGMGGYVMDGEHDGDAAGWSVGGGGDINGDGVVDLLVGAERSDPNGEASGRGYVVFGVPTSD